MKFMLEIELENDAMQTGEDVSIALRGVADRMEMQFTGVLGPNEASYGQRSIRDQNGNTVGNWSIQTP